MSRRIGITGGVGCGKSTVLKMICDKVDAFVIEADKVGHIVMKKGMPAYYEVTELFGKDIVDESGEVDRKKLAERVFGNKELLAKLNGIIHPAVKRYILEKIEENSDKEYIFVEAALLIEAGYKEFLDETWYIYASKDIRTERLIESRGYSKEKVESIICNQLSEEDFRNNCNKTINNNGSIEELSASIDSALA